MRINLFILMAIFVQIACADDPEVTIFLTDQTGRKINSVQSGTQFRVVIDFESYGPEYYDKVTMQNAEPFKIIDKSIISSSFNSSMRRKQKKQFVFTMRCDQIGEFVCGPIVFEGRPGTFVTNRVRISVVMPNAKTHSPNEPHFLEIGPSLNPVYVGQLVPVEVRFWSQVSRNNKLQFIAPDANGSFNFVNISPSTYFEEKLHHTNYKVAQSHMMIVPKKPGTFVIPPLEGLLDTGIPQAFYFFGTSKKVVSNALKIDVKPVPPHKGPVDGVGSFSNFMAEVDKTEVEVGGAIKLKLTLSGNAYFKDITSLRTKLDKDLKFFPSHQTIAKNLTSKTFEYILQPLKEGEYVVGPQEFVYFDPTLERFKTIRTPKIELHVKPAPVNFSPAVAQDEPSPATEEKDGVGHEIEDVHVFIKMPSEPKSALSLPLWVMILLVLLFLLYVIRDTLSRFAVGVTVAVHRWFAFSVARRKLARAEKQTYWHEIFPILMELFVKRGVTCQMSMRDLKIALPHHVKSAKERDKIVEFLSEAESCYYAPHVKSEKQLFQQARTLINELSKIL